MKKEDGGAVIETAIKCNCDDDAKDCIIRVMEEVSYKSENKKLGCLLLLFPTSVFFTQLGFLGESKVCLSSNFPAKLKDVTGRRRRLLLLSEPQIRHFFHSASS